MPQCDELHKRMEIAQAAVASAVANRLSKARHTMKFRLHSAVLDENAVIGGPIPINLAIEVVSIQALGSRKKVVVDIAGSRHVWRGRRAMICAEIGLIGMAD